MLRKHRRRSPNYDTAASDSVESEDAAWLKRTRASREICVRRNILAENLQMDPAPMPLGATGAFKQKISDKSQFTN